MDGDTVSLWSHNIKIVTVTLTKSRTAKNLGRKAGRQAGRGQGKNECFLCKFTTCCNLVVECTRHIPVHKIECTQCASFAGNNAGGDGSVPIWRGSARRQNIREEFQFSSSFHHFWPKFRNFQQKKLFKTRTNFWIVRVIIPQLDGILYLTYIGDFYVE